MISTDVMLLDVTEGELETLVGNPTAIQCEINELVDKCSEFVIESREDTTKYAYMLGKLMVYYAISQQGRLGCIPDGFLHVFQGCTPWVRFMFSVKEHIGDLDKRLLALADNLAEVQLPEEFELKYGYLVDNVR